MKRAIFSISALSCVLLFAGRAPAQHNVNDNSDFVIENLCDPQLSQDFEQAEIFAGLDFDQLEKLRIELLERGFDPGFDPDRDTTIDSQLMTALAQFQAEYELPVTGLPDADTLAALSIRA